VASKETRVGEPVSVQIEISGEGNFSRISNLAFETEEEDWKVYPPKVSFESTDTFGTKGTKTFEFLLIPQTTEVDAIPAFKWSYFNPEGETYQSLTLPPAPVTVEPAARRNDGGVVSFNQEEEETTPSPAAPPQALRPDPGEWRRLPYRPERNPAFWWLQGGLLVLATAIAGGVVLRRRRSADPDSRIRAALGKSARRALQEASEAAAKGDAATFYTAAIRAIQRLLVSQRKLTAEAESLVYSELTPVLAATRLSAEEQAFLRRLFESSDALRFGRVEVPASTLKEDEAQLKTVLKKLSEP